jgi:hypothetical protein
MTARARRCPGWCSLSVPFGSGCELDTAQARGRSHRRGASCRAYGIIVADDRQRVGLDAQSFRPRRSQRERLHSVGSLLRDGSIAARNPEDRTNTSRERVVRPGLTSRTSTSWTGVRRRPICISASTRGVKSRLTPSTVWESRPAFGRMVRRGTATTLLVTTRLTCSTRMGTTLRPCTATSETSATV